MLKDEYAGDFFTLAVYITDNLIAQRYILYQPKESNIGVDSVSFCLCY